MKKNSCLASMDLEDLCWDCRRNAEIKIFDAFHKGKLKSPVIIAVEQSFGNGTGRDVLASSAGN
jgi:hypothetical protein